MGPLPFPPQQRKITLRRQFLHCIPKSVWAFDLVFYIQIYNVGNPIAKKTNEYEVENLLPTCALVSDLVSAGKETISVTQR